MNCGAVYSHGENAFDFTVSNFADNKNIIIPMFKTYPTFARKLEKARVQGIKQLEYQDFCLRLPPPSCCCCCPSTLCESCFILAYARIKPASA